MSKGRLILAVVPVKRLTMSKSRLGRVLDQEQRADLAEAMLTDVLGALAAVGCLAGFAVTTSDPKAAAIAVTFGARILDDALAPGLSAAVGAAASAIGAEGLDGILILPADIPAVTADDIRTLVERHPPGPCVSIVPSHDGDGTNALLCSPAGLADPAYGPGSFTAHVEAARARGVRCVVQRIERIARDVDYPADLEAVMRLGAGAKTTELVDRWHGQVPGI